MFFLESFGIHSYNLFKFFYAGKNKRDTDIIAENFDIRREFFKSNRTPKKKLENIENRRNKEIAHLTYNCIYRNKRTKPWNFGLISKDMEQTIKAFIDSLLDKHHSLFNNI